MPLPRSITFSFGSSALTTEQDYAVVRLAICMIKDPRSRGSVLLVGRASPRGGAPYNLALGLERARRVKDALVARGVSADRITVTSAGEGTNVGGSPSAWKDEQRVDVVFLPTVARSR